MNAVEKLIEKLEVTGNITFQDLLGLPVRDSTIHELHSLRILDNMYPFISMDTSFTTDDLLLSTAVPRMGAHFLADYQPEYVNGQYNDVIRSSLILVSWDMVPFVVYRLTNSLGTLNMVKAVLDIGQYNHSYKELVYGIPANYDLSTCTDFNVGMAEHVPKEFLFTTHVDETDETDEYGDLGRHQPVFLLDIS